ncbi:uracil-DNA glycosylase [Puniceicoccaceae bacterium]|nr:uracil-DNA glycosylase [Puniceicoccaceae bacterium]
MSAGLKAIANELRRLQRDGVDRVFVEDHTLEQLIPVKACTPTTQEPSAESPSTEHPDLKKLVGTTVEAEPQAKAPKKIVSQVSYFAPIPEEAPKVRIAEGAAETQLAFLREQVHSCPVCNEHLSERGKVVFGTGSATADILFCGEAPGADEEITGDPFVGKAGQLFTKIITAMGLSRESVYITNILKWRPEHDKPYGNRPPTLDEMRYCLPYLEAQIKIIKPKAIVALGNTAVSGLLGPDPTRKMGQVRGTWASFAKIPVMITFHPSYLLRNGTLKTKRMVWEDMLKLMEKCQLAISEKQRGFFLPKS